MGSGDVTLAESWSAWPRIAALQAAGGTRFYKIPTSLRLL